MVMEGSGPRNSRYTVDLLTPRRSATCSGVSSTVQRSSAAWLSASSGGGQCLGTVQGVGRVVRSEGARWAPASSVASTGSGAKDVTGPGWTAGWSCRSRCRSSGATTSVNTRLLGQSHPATTPGFVAVAILVNSRWKGEGHCRNSCHRGFSDSLLTASWDPAVGTALGPAWKPPVRLPSSLWRLTDDCHVLRGPAQMRIWRGLTGWPASLRVPLRGRRVRESQPAGEPQVRSK